MAEHACRYRSQGGRHADDPEEARPSDGDGASVQSDGRLVSSRPKREVVSKPVGGTHGSCEQESDFRREGRWFGSRGEARLVERGRAKRDAPTGGYRGGAGEGNWWRAGLDDLVHGGAGGIFDREYSVHRRALLEEWTWNDRMEGETCDWMLLTHGSRGHWRDALLCRSARKSARRPVVGEGTKREGQAQ